MQTTLLILHIVAGTTALVSGLLAILTAKGKRLHRKSGRLYFWAMITVGLTAIPLALMKENWFLFGVAFLSAYLSYAGKRSIDTKLKGWKGFDYAVMGICLLAGLGMLAWGISGIVRGQIGMFPVLITFGGLLTGATLQDAFVPFRRKPLTKGAYILLHISRMGGSYIAASTAFLVVNWQSNPQFIAWLLPTVLGTPLITYASMKWKRKFRALPKAESAGSL